MAIAMRSVSSPSPTIEWLRNDLRLAGNPTFNLVLQGDRFDPNGFYIRRSIAELAQLGNDCIQMPWTADEAALTRAGVRLGDTYPRPIVDHAAARARALAIYERLP